MKLLITVSALCWSAAAYAQEPKVENPSPELSVEERAAIQRQATPEVVDRAQLSQGEFKQQIERAEAKVKEQKEKSSK